MRPCISILPSPLDRVLFLALLALPALPAHPEVLSINRLAPRLRSYAGDIALVDVDGDGALDIVATGGSSHGPSTDDRVYMNDHSCRFTRDLSSSLLVRGGDPNILANGMAWADYDADGDVDVLMLLLGIFLQILLLTLVLS